MTRNLNPQQSKGEGTIVVGAVAVVVSLFLLIIYRIISGRGD